MADTYQVTIARLEGSVIELDCTTGTAGGRNDFATTRSFVILALAEGVRRLALAGTGIDAALAAAGASLDPFCETDAAFYREHAGTMLASTELLEREHVVVDEDALRQHVYDLEDAGKNEREIEAMIPRHRFTLRATAVSPALLEGLAVGQTFATTAFDVWVSDPASVIPPSCPQRPLVLLPV